MRNHLQKPYINILHNGKVVLYLPNVQFNKRRYIGKIDKEKKTFITFKRNRGIHLFRKNNSLSFPYDLIYRRNKGFIYICANLEGIKLWTSVLALKIFGEIMKFSKQGYETQIFLPVDKFKKSKKEAKNERRILKEEVKNEKR